MIKAPVFILLLAALCLGLGGCVSVSQTAAPTTTPAPTLPPHYPAERLPLPEESAVYDFTTIVDGDKQTDYVVLTLLMNREEAAAYFKPLLEKDSEYYTESESDIVPLEIQGAYSDAKEQMELFARYSHESVNATVMRVNIYTLADKKTVAAVQIQITYRTKPQ